MREPCMFSWCDCNASSKSKDGLLLEERHPALRAQRNVVALLFAFLVAGRRATEAYVYVSYVALRSTAVESNVGRYFYYQHQRSSSTRE